MKRPCTLKMRDDRKGKERFWLTPPDLMAELQAEFAFDFDACPHPRPPRFDGRKAVWGSRNWVNPPFAGNLMAAFVKRAIQERDERGALTVMAIPPFAIQSIEKAALAGADFRVRVVKWISIESGRENRPRVVMLAIFRPREAPL